jgi:hypothetical protein
LGPAFGPSKPLGFSHEIAVGFGSDVGFEVVVTIDFGTPSRVTPGTVLRTVLAVVAGSTV